MVLGIEEGENNELIWGGDVGEDNYLEGLWNNIKKSLEVWAGLQQLQLEDVFSHRENSKKSEKKMQSIFSKPKNKHVCIGEGWVMGGYVALWFLKDLAAQAEKVGLTL